MREINVIIPDDMGKGHKKNNTTKKWEVDLSEFVDGVSIQFKNGKLVVPKTTFIGEKDNITDLNTMGACDLEPGVYAFSTSAGATSVVGYPATGKAYTGIFAKTSTNAMMFVSSTGSGSEQEAWVRTATNVQNCSAPQWSNWERIDPSEVPTVISGVTPIVVNQNKVSLNYNEGDFTIVDGKLSLREKACVNTKNLTDLTAGGLNKIGVTCFYFNMDSRNRSTIVIGAPVDMYANTDTQPAITHERDVTHNKYSDGGGVDVPGLPSDNRGDANGWQIATPTEVTQTLIANGVAWTRSNPGGMHDNGSLASPTTWSPWRREANVPSAPAGVANTASNGVKLVGSDFQLSYDTDDFAIVGGKLKLKATPTSPTESKYVDVRVSATTNKHQIGEADTATLIYTVTNTGSATASLVTLDITNPSLANKRIKYGNHEVSKAKAGAVNKVSDTRYTIANLESGGSVAISIPATFQDFGAYSFSVLGTVSSDNVDKSADDNRGAVVVEVTSTRDSSYQPTAACPALNVVDVSSGKTLLLMDYGTATYITNENQFQQEQAAQPATMNRLNVYAPNTTSIKLRAVGAGTAVVHGYNIAGVTTNGLQETLNKPDGVYTFLNMTERSTGYDFNGRRYAVKPQLFVGTKSGSSANGGNIYVMSAIQRDKRTYFGTTPKGVTSSLNDEVLTINGLKPGTWLAVSFRPRGTNCEWQTVLISVPLDVTEKLSPGLKLSRKSGTASHISIASGLTSRADVVGGYLNINGNVGPDTPIVALDMPQNDKAVVNAPAGAANTYVLTVTGGKLDPQTTSVGNIAVTPNASGTELTIAISASATAADNFIYRNNGVVVELKVA